MRRLSALGGAAGVAAMTAKHPRERIGCTIIKCTRLSRTAMRTTLDLDDDVLASAKEIARRENKTAGRVLSELARRALTQPVPASPGAAAREPAPAFGFRPFARRGAVVTNERIQQLRDEGEG